MRAWLALLIVVGCGDDGPGSVPDAPSDAAADAPDAGEALVTVTVTESGVPAVGASVYFQNPDSSLVRMSTTDADGKAGAPVSEGGFVTVIEPRPSAIGVVVLRDRLSTFAGVKPGDELHLDVRPLPSTTTTFLVQIPEDLGVELYDLHTTCGRAQLSVVATTRPSPVTLDGCAGIEDMLVISTDAQGLPLRALYQPAQPVADGATLIFTGTYVDVADIASSLTGSPAWVRSSVVEVMVTSARGPLFSAFGSLEPPMTEVTVGLPVPAGTTATVRADLYPVQPAVARQTVLAWGMPIADHTIDVATAVVRQITTNPVFDPAARMVTWTEEPGKAPDVVRVELYTYREGDPAHAWTWQLVAPHGGPVVTFPVLQGPAAAAFTTTATDSFTVSELETLAIDGGYDRVRPRGLRRDLGEVPPGAVGQLTYQRLDVENLLVGPTLRPLATFTRAMR